MLWSHRFWIYFHWADHPTNAIRLISVIWVTHGRKKNSHFMKRRWLPNILMMDIRIAEWFQEKTDYCDTSPGTFCFLGRNAYYPVTDRVKQRSGSGRSICLTQWKKYIKLFILFMSGCLHKSDSLLLCLFFIRTETSAYSATQRL